MIFRPCIDIHQGKVKQIVGSTLSDGGALENFVSKDSAGAFAERFRRDGLTGGHVIMLDKSEQTKAAASEALYAYPGGLQIGGGINADNAPDYLAAGASHVIVTSYIFSGGRIDRDNLKKLCRVCGKEKVVLDLSCKKSPDGQYIIATDRWQQLTSTALTEAFLEELSAFCGEYLVHAVDAEGKKAGIDESLISLLAASPLPVTYAGGIADIADVETVRRLGREKVDFTVGSALDLFGGHLSYKSLTSFRKNP